MKRLGKNFLHIQCYSFAEDLSPLQWIWALCFGICFVSKLHQLEIYEVPAICILEFQRRVLYLLTEIRDTLKQREVHQLQNEFNIFTIEDQQSLEDLERALMDSDTKKQMVSACHHSVYLLFIQWKSFIIARKSVCYFIFLLQYKCTHTYL